MSKAGAIRAGRAYVELFTDQSAFVQGLAAAEGRLKAFGDKVASIGRSMMSLGAIAAAPFALGGKIFAGFEEQMLTVQAVTQSSRADFEALTDQAKRLGAATSFTAKQVAEGMTSLGRAGFKTDEIQAAIPAVLNLARATGTDLGEAADYAANTVRAFGLSASDTAMVADVLTATANNSAQTVTDLAQALSYVAPVAADAGETIQSTSVALGVLANMGIKGSMAGTTLRQILVQLADAGTRARLQEMGVAATDAAGNLRPLGDVLTDVGKAMAKLPTAKKLSLAKELFDQRAMSGALKLSGSVEQIEKVSQAVYNSGQVAEKTAALIDSGVKGAWFRMTSAAEGAALAIGDAIASKLIVAMDAIAGVAQAVGSFVGGAKDLVAWAAAAAVGLVAAGAAAWAFGKIVLALKAGVAVFTGLYKAIKAVQTAMLAASMSRNVTGILGVLGAIKTGIASAVSGVGGLGVALGGIVAPLAALGVGFTLIANMAERARADMEYIRNASQSWADAEREASRARGDARSAANPQEEMEALKRLAAAYERQRDIIRQDIERLRAMYRGQLDSDPQKDRIIQGEEVKLLKLLEMLKGVQERMGALKRSSRDGSSPVLPPGMGGQREELGKQADALADKLENEAILFGLAGREAEIFRLRLAGASDAQLRAARAAAEHLDALERSAKARQRLDQAERDMQAKWLDLNGTPEQKREFRVQGYMAEEGFDRAQAEWLVKTEDDLAAAAERRDRALAARRSDAERTASIEELRLRTQYEGAELERRLLDLQEKRAIEAARAAGERVDLVEQEYALRRAAEAAQQAATYTLKTEAAGTFNVAALQSLVAGGVQDRIAAATQETARNTKRLVENSGRGIVLA